MIQIGMTRLSQLSMNYYIRHVMSFHIEGEKPSTTDRVSYKLRRGNLVVTKDIDVYIDGALVDKDKYDVYPQDGLIVFKTPTAAGEEVTCDYWFTFVNVLDAYTSEEEIDIPLVAIDDIGDEEEAIELGSTNKLVYVTYKLNVYGNSEAQRDDMVDMLRPAFSDQSVPIWDFNRGFPVDYEGKLIVGGGGFDKDITVGKLTFSSVDVVRNPLQSSEPIERGRAIMTLTGEYIRKNK